VFAIAKVALSQVKSYILKDIFEFNFYWIVGLKIFVCFLSISSLIYNDDEKQVAALNLRLQRNEASS
jgi:hypothetical protein